MGWARVEVCILLSLLLISLAAVSISAQDCPDPPAPCTFCGDDVVQRPNGWGVNEVCDGDVGCDEGYTCNGACTACTQTGCNNDGTCQTSVESYATCPNDCEAPCEPQCSGNTCGADGCGGYCPPNYDDCGAGKTCYLGDCCTLTCPATDSSVACGSYATPSNGCGGTCSVPGTKCTDPSKPNCNLATGTCQQCTSAAQCDDQNACTIDTCTSGSCAHAPAAMGTTCPAGKCTANGLCWPVCTATPGCTSPQPPNTDQISSRYCDPRGDFSVDYCYACKSGYAWSGTACVASSCTIGTCTQGMAPYCSAGKSYTCVSGCLQAATCTNGCNATTGLCNGGASCTDECTSNGCIDTNTPYTCGEAGDGDSCTEKIPRPDCTGATPICQDGSCVQSCSNECAYAGERGCDAAVPWLCKAPDATHACLWKQRSAACTGSTPYCSAGTCTATAPCTHACTFGHTQCNGTTLQTCAYVGSCTAWTNAATCPNSCVETSETAAECASCTHDCAEGSKGCEANTPWTCGENDADACREKINGTACTGATPFCSDAACTGAAIGVPSAATITLNTPYTLNLTLTPENQYLKLRADKFNPIPYDTPGARKLTFQPTNPADVGSHTVTIRAEDSRQGGAGIVTERTITITIRCDPINTCCAANGDWKSESATCTTPSDHPGTCTATHSCACIPEYTYACYDDDVYWENSCKQRGTKKTDCTATQICQATTSTCVEKADLGICTDTYTYECRNNEARKIDQGCGAVTLIEKCGTTKTCHATNTSATCKDKAPCDDRRGTTSRGWGHIDGARDPVDCGRVRGGANGGLVGRG